MAHLRYSLVQRANVSREQWPNDRLLQNRFYAIDISAEAGEGPQRHAPFDTLT